MKVQALLVLTDLSFDGAPEMTVLVEGEVSVFRHRDESLRFGPWRAIAAVWGRPEEGIGLERGEGGRAEIDRAQDLIDAKDNQWRVMEALASAYDKKRGGAMTDEDVMVHLGWLRIEGNPAQRAAVDRAVHILRAAPVMADALQEAIGEMPTCTRPDCRCAFHLGNAALTAYREGK